MLETYTIIGEGTPFPTRSRGLKHFSGPVGKKVR
jgi:hypothetical protein